MGMTSSSPARELTHELLPFAIKLHLLIPERLSLALYHTLKQAPGVKLYFKEPPLRAPALESLLYGFIAIHARPAPIISYYQKVLAEQLEIHGPMLIKEPAITSKNKE